MSRFKRRLTLGLWPFMSPIFINLGPRLFKTNDVIMLLVNVSIIFQTMLNELTS